MKQERMEILEMLKEEKVSIEEAERLLSALDQSAESESHEKDSTDENSDWGHYWPDFGKGQFRDFGRMFRGFGKMFRHSMHNTFQDMPFFEQGDDFASEETSEDGYSVTSNSTLHIRQPRNTWNGSGDIKVYSGKEQTLRITGDHILRTKENKYHLICRGNCSIYIPDSFDALTVSLYNGNIEIENLLIPASLNTMNGDVFVSQSVLGELCNTMSGNIQIIDSQTNEKETSVSTMSGNIEVMLPTDWSGNIQAGTTSGETIAEVPDEYIDKSGSFMQKRMKITIPGDSAVINCMSMSGNVKISQRKEV